MRGARSAAGTPLASALTHLAPRAERKFICITKTGNRYGGQVWFDGKKYHSNPVLTREAAARDADK